jgi:hypothetical protein
VGPFSPDLTLDADKVTSVSNNLERPSSSGFALIIMQGGGKNEEKL